MPVEDTPTRRSRRTPASTKKYEEFVTDMPRTTTANTNKRDTLKTTRAKSPAASRSKSPVSRRAKSSATAVPQTKDVVQRPSAEEDKTGRKGTRRASKRLAKAGDSPTEETVIKKCKGVGRKPTKLDEPDRVAESEEDPAPSSPVEGVRTPPPPETDRVAESEDPAPLSPVKKVPTPPRPGAAAVETQRGPEREQARNKPTSPRTPGLTSTPLRDTDTDKETEKEHLVWQPIATVPNTGNASIGKDTLSQAIEVNVAMEEARKLSSKGPVNITPTSEIYKALKKALETHRTKAMQGKSVGDSIQIALRVLTPKQNQPSSSQQVSTSRQSTSAPGPPYPLALSKKGTTFIKSPTAQSVFQNRASTSGQLISSIARPFSTIKQPTTTAVHKSIGSMTPTKKSPTKSAGLSANPGVQSEVHVDVIRPYQGRGPTAGRAALSSQGYPASPGEVDSPGKQERTSTIVPIGRRRLRTVPTQTLADDLTLCRNVNERSFHTSYGVISVSADKISKPKLRTVHGGTHRRGRASQTEMTLSGLEVTILEALRGDDGKAGGKPSDEFSLGHSGSKDGGVDRRIQAMLFGQDLDMVMAKGQGKVVSNVAHDPSDGNHPPSAKVTLESWSLALACGEAVTSAPGQGEAMQLP